MASSAVEFAVKRLGTLLVMEAKYLYGVSNKIELLQSALKAMQCFLADADNRQHKESVVAQWVADIRDFAYEAEDIVDKYHCRVSHHRKDGKWNTIKWFSCVLCDIQPLHDVGSKIDGLRTRISDLTETMKVFGIQMSSLDLGSADYTAAMREQRRTYAHTEDEPIGLEEEVEEVVAKLMNYHEGKVVGISGMGGLGKTTLARSVFHNADVRKHFKNNRVWVYISKQFEKKDIYQEILIGLSNIGKGDGNNSERSRIRDLTYGELAGEISGILKEKQCLVVLDDLWKKEDWKTLKPAFEGIKSTSGSKILITTRDEGVIQYADKGGYRSYLHKLKLLSEEDSWKLQKSIAFTEKENIDNKETIVSEDSTKKPEEIRTTGESSAQAYQTNLQDDEKKAKEKMSREMLKHCKGLPLAIKALGGLLSTKRTIRDWETVKINISAYLMSDDMVDECDDKELSSVLELSYYDLPFYLKRCFMYLGIFPEDYTISTDRLYHLWEAEDLVTASEYVGVALDDNAESFLNQLVKRSMVQVEKTWSNGRIKSCRLHDMMRDLCLKKCKEMNFLNIIEHGSLEGSAAADKKLRRCAIYLKGPGSLLGTSLNNSPCIRSLAVFPQGHDKAGELLWETLEALSLVRALDIEETNLLGYFTIRVGNFIHLRYLSIKGSTTFLPSGIWDCKYLETLDLRVRNTVELKKKHEFWRLERLRHLYLPELIGVGSLILDFKTNQLQQMETFKNFNPNCCKIEDLGKMTNIKVFTLCSSEWTIDKVLARDGVKCLLDSPMIMTNCLVKPLNLYINAAVINEDPTILITRVPHSCIGGAGIFGKINVEMNDIVQIFPHYLTSVKLQDCEIDEKGIQILEELPQLKKLYLLDRGTKVSKISFSKKGFAQLVKLTLGGLDELEELVVEEEEALPNLQYVYIEYCRSLKKIPENFPSSVHIECYRPCVKGIEYYNTCPYSRRIHHQSQRTTSLSNGRNRIPHSNRNGTWLNPIRWIQWGMIRCIEGPPEYTAIPKPRGSTPQR